MSDDDPVDAFVEGSIERFEEDDEPLAPQTRDLEAELRERTGVDADGTADFSAADTETATAFWAAVAYVNVGILLLALGPTVYAIRGRPLISATLSVAGAALLLRAYSVYRSFEARNDADEEDATEVETDVPEADDDSVEADEDDSEADDSGS